MCENLRKSATSSKSCSTVSICCATLVCTFWSRVACTKQGSVRFGCTLAIKENIWLLKSSSHRGCLKIILTGINIKISIVQKLHEWSNCPFPKMIPRLENHFGKIPAQSFIYFLNYACFNIKPSPNNYGTPSSFTSFNTMDIQKKTQNWMLSFTFTIRKNI